MFGLYALFSNSFDDLSAFVRVFLLLLPSFVHQGQLFLRWPPLLLSAYYEPFLLLLVSANIFSIKFQVASVYFNAFHLNNDDIFAVVPVASCRF